MGQKRTTDRKKIYAPFGVAIKRFATIGFHPNLDPSGSLQKTGGLGPGQYNVKYQDCLFKSHCKTESWSRKKEMEEFSNMLGYRNAEILRTRKEALRANGPGTLNINESLFKAKSHNVKTNLLSGKEKRFRDPIKKLNPPPGTYGKNHDPYLRKEEAGRPVHQWTPLPTFEWDSFINRFKIGRYEPKGSLAPNRYKNIFQVGIEQTIAKKVTKRGPYDTFTGPRDGTTIKGYFAPTKDQKPKSWPMKLPGEIEKLNAKDRKHYGQFLRGERFSSNPGLRLMLTDITMCPKNPNDPGPGHYDISKPTTFRQNPAAFNQSVLNVRPVKQWEIMPGVGRYNPLIPKCKFKDKRESWFFKSKAQRGFYTVLTFNAF